MFGWEWERVSGRVLKMEFNPAQGVGLWVQAKYLVFCRVTPATHSLPPPPSSAAYSVLSASSTAFLSSPQSPNLHARPPVGPHTATSSVSLAPNWPWVAVEQMLDYRVVCLVFSVLFSSRRVYTQTQLRMEFNPRRLTHPAARYLLRFVPCLGTRDWWHVKTWSGSVSYLQAWFGNSEAFCEEKKKREVAIFKCQKRFASCYDRQYEQV